MVADDGPVAGFRRWRATRSCEHPEHCRRERLIDLGQRKMFWCVRCERTWFS
jgi:hypothetical protein